MQFHQRSSLMLLVVMALNCLCFSTVHAATDAVPVFSIVETSATATTKGATADLTFIKQIHVHSSADNSIAAIAALALDLPGQVFISYASTAVALPAGSNIVTSGGALLGAISVYASSEALANSVGAVSKRAMTGAKLALSSNMGSNSTTSKSDFVLTEIVLLKKTALKKLLTNGAADVVVLDNVLFTKSKDDYPNFPNAKKSAWRALRDTAATSAATTAATSNTTRGWTLERYKNEIINGPNQSNWLLYPPPTAAAATTNNNNIPLGVELSTYGTVTLYRTDTDLLPPGAIGLLRMSGEEVATATATIGSLNSSDAGAADAYETLNIAITNSSTHIDLELAPYVVVQKPSPTNHTYFMVSQPNKTVTDTSLIVLLNGTGNVIVAADKSAVYVDSADFVSNGAGILYVAFRELYGDQNVAVRYPNYAGTYRNGNDQSPDPWNSFTFTPDRLCYHVSSGFIMGFGENVDMDSPCVALLVPAKTGRASGLAAATVPMKPWTKSAGAVSAMTMPLVVLVALAIGLLALM